MDPVTAVTAVSAVIGAVTTLLAAWIRERGRSRRAREESRRGLLRDLPPGTRVIDLGEHGMVIEVGSVRGPGSL